MKKLYIGIDEAGRGPWAGPLSVAGIATFDLEIFEKIQFLNDSKKLSENRREEIFKDLKNFEKENKIQIFHIFKSANEIDNLGIRESNRIAMREIILKFLEKNNFKNFKNKFFINIFVDGVDNFNFEIPDFENIFAKKKTKNQKINNENNFEKNEKNNSEMGFFCEKNFIKFLISGDSILKIISAASIIAKYERDAYMKRISIDFPEYDFDKNKGYGTAKHKQAILNYGIKNEHRKTYKPIKSLIS